MVHQRRHRQFLLICLITIVGSLHSVPVIRRTAKIRRERLTPAVDLAHIGVRPHADSRPLVVVHHLGHCRRHTSSRTTFSCVVNIHRAQIVIWFALIPCQVAKQRSDLSGRCRTNLACATTCCTLGQSLDLSFIFTQPPFHVGWHIVKVESAAVGIAKHIARPFIRSHDDIAVRRATVEHIVAVASVRPLRRVRQAQFHPGLRGAHHPAGNSPLSEVTGNLKSLVNANLLSLQAHACCQEASQRCQ